MTFRKSMLASAVALAGLASGPASATVACYATGKTTLGSGYLVLRALQIGSTVPTSEVGQPQLPVISDIGGIPQQVVYALHGKGVTTFLNFQGSEELSFNALTGTAVVAKGAGILIHYTGTVDQAVTTSGGGSSAFASMISGACSSRDPGLFPQTLSCRVVGVTDKVDEDSTPSTIYSRTFALTKVPRETPQCNYFWVPPNPQP